MPSESASPEHSIRLTDNPGLGVVRLSPSEGFPVGIWHRIDEFCGESAIRRPGAQDIELNWSDALLLVPEIGNMRSMFGFKLLPDGGSTERFKRAQAERRAVAAARADNIGKLLSPSEVEAQLISLGFSLRPLKEFQKEDVAHLTSLKHGANFSVPGAGKTTTALAVHTLIRSADTKLLVVAPKNAFGAWEETLEKCLVPNAPNRNAAAFFRLTGTESEMSEALFGDALKFLVTYEKFSRNLRLFTLFLDLKPVHLVLDESHRIKAGEVSQRGKALLSVSAFPYRKDILSGTPIPNDVGDLISQIQFLWPTEHAAKFFDGNAAPKTALKNLYVRTTKSQLGLTPPKRIFIKIGMSPCHAAFYSMLRDITLQQIAGVKRAQIDLVAARRSVIRLLQASTNPLGTLFRIMGDGEMTGAFKGVAEGLIAEGHSQKLLKVRELVAGIRAAGRKVVVWTIFTDTIVRLTDLLAEYRPLVIYGNTPTGLPEDEETREGQIKLFHDKAELGVLIANPAACSEGISLHTVCHEAIYVDRSYNAAHYLQSVDRIHRIGLDPNVETRIHILQSAAPAGIGSIDFSVSRRLLKKMETMTAILEDEDIRTMALDEEQAEDPVDTQLTQEDLVDLLEQLSSDRVPTEEEQI